MSQTIAWRMNRAKVMLQKYAPTLVISDQVLQLNVHLSRNDVFKRYIPQRENLARKFAAINDGANYPVDWLRYADNATYATGGSTYPLEFIPVEKIPFVKSQPLFKAYPETPKIALFDQAIHFYPAGLQAVQVEYYWRPVDLWKSDNSIALTTTDNMPMETEYAIVRGAVERSVALAENKQIAAQLMEKNRLNSEEAAIEWYQEVTGASLKGVIPLV